MMIDTLQKPNASIDTIYFDEAQNLTDEMIASIEAIRLPKAQPGTFYQRHALAIWTAIVVTGLYSLHLLFRDNMHLVWTITTPLMEYMP